MSIYVNLCQFMSLFLHKIIAMIKISIQYSVIVLIYYVYNEKTLKLYKFILTLKQNYALVPPYSISQTLNFKL